MQGNIAILEAILHHSRELADGRDDRRQSLRRIDGTGHGDRIEHGDRILDRSDSRAATLVAVECLVDMHRARGAGPCDRFHVQVVGNRIERACRESHQGIDVAQLGMLRCIEHLALRHHFDGHFRAGERMDGKPLAGHRSEHGRRTLGEKAEFGISPRVVHCVQWPYREKIEISRNRVLVSARAIRGVGRIGIANAAHRVKPCVCSQTRQPRVAAHLGEPGA